MRKLGPQKVSYLVQGHLNLRLAGQGYFHPRMLQRHRITLEASSDSGAMTQSHCRLLLMVQKIFIL